MRKVANGAAGRKRMGGRKAAAIAFGLIALYLVPLAVQFARGRRRRRPSPTRTGATEGC